MYIHTVENKQKSKPGPKKLSNVLGQDLWDCSFFFSSRSTLLHRRAPVYIRRERNNDVPKKEGYETYVRIIDSSEVHDDAAISCGWRPPGMFVSLAPARSLLALALSLQN